MRLLLSARPWIGAAAAALALAAPLTATPAHADPAGTTATPVLVGAPVPPVGDNPAGNGNGNGNGNSNAGDGPDASNGNATNGNASNSNASNSNASNSNAGNDPNGSNDGAGNDAGASNDGAGNDAGDAGVGATGATPTTEPAGDPGAGAQAAGTIIVTGRAWQDRNRNGIQDRNEPGVAGLPVIVMAVQSGAMSLDKAQVRDRLKAALSGDDARSLEPSGDLVAELREATTGPAGWFRFRGLPAGEVFAVLGAGQLDSDGFIPEVQWRFSPMHAGTDATRDSDFDTSLFGGEPPMAGVAGPVTVGAGETLRLDAGLYPVDAEGTGGGLPITGGNGVLLVGAGAALLLGGVTVVAATRRRRAG